MKTLRRLATTVLVVCVLALLYGLSPLRPVREILTVTTIDAPPAQVWQTLTAFDHYGQWNPLYPTVDGRRLVGERLQVEVRMSDRSYRFRPTLARLDEPRSMEWSEHLLLPGLYDGRHRFLLEPIEGGGTRFVQHEIYSGALAPLMLSLYGAPIEDSFRLMNEALKKRVEQLSSL